MAVQHMTDETIAEFFADHLSRVDDDTQRAVALEVLEWVHEKYPELGVRIAWNQPMFTLGGTFIIGFSYAKKHMAIAPERAGIEKFSDEFDAHGLSYGKMMVRFPWPKDGKAESMPLDLLAKMIEFNMEDKRGMTKFWR
ncbi:iron chaperone [Corynebacterium amycolatum]|uniref:iron chaperone n=1 Tax=Corynebacterium amycolatum TaxID=43765 RepID=UPI000185C2FA|nr:DUF1801 domain-containing protein [Corynebacterium amycolatum]EEB62362.1 hypothetical protein CORAM0001_1844 [Corynebacterium amycolatum SK46]